MGERQKIHFVKLRPGLLRGKILSVYPFFNQLQFVRWQVSTRDVPFFFFRSIKSNFSFIL